MNIETIPFTTSNGVTVNNRLWSGDAPTRKLMILYPGRGYTIDNPLLHFLAEVGVQNGMDVFGVQYEFQAIGGAFDRSQSGDIAAEAQRAVDDFLDSRSYQYIIPAGKSLGTPLASQFAINDKRTIACILLTPIPGSLDDALTVPTLGVIGTADPFYGMLSDEVKDPPENITWQVVDDANHGLEVPNWDKTITILRETMTACEQFIQANL
jgi:hypothetical protein